MMRVHFCKNILLFAGLCLPVLPGVASAAAPAKAPATARGSVVVTLHKLTSDGAAKISAGTITITQTPDGLLFTPDLHGLPEGVHGFHIHTNGSCEPGKNAQGKMVPGLAAGGHYDPGNTGRHAGPYGQGHAGDLPVLYADQKGNVTLPVLAPRLHSLQEIAGRSLMVHAGGDNYSDHPALGGGGARMDCGVIPAFSGVQSRGQSTRQGR